MLKVVVREKEWLNGDPAHSYLLRKTDGLMCCLGFACEAAGVPREQLVGRGTPLNLLEQRVLNVPRLEALPEALAGLVVGNDNTRTCRKLMVVNDSSFDSVKDDHFSIRDWPALANAPTKEEFYKVKKEIITSLGAEVGLEFEFVP